MVLFMTSGFQRDGVRTCVSNCGVRRHVHITHGLVHGKKCCLLDTCDGFVVTADVAQSLPALV